MSISYSGLVGYGKVTLPSVDSWGTNMNILKDPPKAVTTRKIDKVGETSYIPELIGESDDRLCEAINYYPRGVNPMTTISYNNDNAGVSSSILNNQGQAFLPYRVVLDGAFRPPIRSQEDLLPLSRLPRIWTEATTQPYKPIFTKRIKNCGTAENTKEVKTDLMNVNCETCKILPYQPDVNEPKVVGYVESTLTPRSVGAFKSCLETNRPMEMVRKSMQPIHLVRNHPVAEGYTSKVGYKEVPMVPKEKDLVPGRPVAQATTNLAKIKEVPIVRNNVVLTSNHPTVSGTTNRSMPGAGEVSYNQVSLPDRPTIHGRSTQFIPKTTTTVPIKNLIRVR